jgi:hypothetical protein
MTAILALNFFGGVLMMSDTEETLSADAKSSCDKLYRFIFKYGNAAGTVIAGGAGDSHLIEYANQELHRLFANKVKGGEDLLETLNLFARKFFKESMQGYHGLHYELVPRFEMLIAVNICNNPTRIFCWKGNRMVMLPGDSHSSIGTGVAQIHPMLRDIKTARRLDNMLFLGLRMMYHAKRAVTGVGGKTEAIALHDDGTTEIFGTETTQKIEDLAINLDEYLNLAVFGDVTAVILDVRDVDENVEKNLAGLPGIMQMYREAYSKILKPPSVSRKSKGRR